MTPSVRPTTEMASEDSEVCTVHSVQYTVQPPLGMCLSSSLSALYLTSRRFICCTKIMQFGYLSKKIKLIWWTIDFYWSPTLSSKLWCVCILIYKTQLRKPFRCFSPTWSYDMIMRQTKAYFLLLFFHYPVLWLTRRSILCSDSLN